MIDLDIRDILAAEHTEAINIIEDKRRYVFYARRTHVKELRILDVLKDERRAIVFLEGTNFHIAEREVLCVTDEEAMRGHFPEHIGFRIFTFGFRRLQRCIFGSSATAMLDVDVV